MLVPAGGNTIEGALMISQNAEQQTQRAFKSLQVLRPHVEEALHQKFGQDWRTEVRSALNEKFPNFGGDLNDHRDLLAILMPIYEKSKKFKPIIEINGIDSQSCKELRAIAIALAHPIRWVDGYEKKATQIVESMLSRMGKRISLSVASSTGFAEVFKVESGKLFHRWYEVHNFRWSDWHEMTCSAVPSHVTTNSVSNELNLFVLLQTGEIEFRVLSKENGWGPWYAIPNGGLAAYGPISVSSMGHNHIEIFALSNEQKIIHRWNNGQEWARWFEFG